jgi:hypothetical protein
MVLASLSNSPSAYRNPRFGNVRVRLFALANLTSAVFTFSRLWAKVTIGLCWATPNEARSDPTTNAIQFAGLCHQHSQDRRQTSRSGGGAYKSTTPLLAGRRRSCARLTGINPSNVCHEHERELEMLYQRWEMAFRSRLTGAGFKPPGAAAFKRRGSERPHCSPKSIDNSCGLRGWIAG